MLEEAPDDADDADAFRESRYARPEAADPPDDQVDLDTGRGGRIEFLDHRRVDEGVHLGDDAGRRAGSSEVRFATNQRDHPLSQIDRSDEQLPVELLAGLPRQR